MKLSHTCGHEHKATHNRLCVQDSWVHVAATHHISSVLADAFTDFLQHTVLCVVKRLWLITLQNLASCADITLWGMVLPPSHATLTPEHVCISSGKSMATEPVNQQGHFNIRWCISSFTCVGIFLTLQLVTLFSLPTLIIVTLIVFFFC